MLRFSAKGPTPLPHVKFKVQQNRGRKFLGLMSMANDLTAEASEKAKDTPVFSLSKVRAPSANGEP